MNTPQAQKWRPLIFNRTLLRFESASSTSHCRCFATWAAADPDSILFLQWFPPFLTFIIHRSFFFCLCRYSPWPLVCHSPRHPEELPRIVGQFIPHGVSTSFSNDRAPSSLPASALSFFRDTCCISPSDFVQKFPTTPYTCALDVWKSRKLHISTRTLSLCQTIFLPFSDSKPFTRFTPPRA